MDGAIFGLSNWACPMSSCLDDFHDNSCWFMVTLVYIGKKTFFVSMVVFGGRENIVMITQIFPASKMNSNSNMLGLSY